jgi:hypothetical protein
MLAKPAIWWPIPRNEGDAAENVSLEFWIRTGAGPYVYYPGAVGAEPATGAVVLAGTTYSETLPAPYGYAAWRGIYRYCAELKAAMDAVASKPAGFAVNWSLADTGELTLTATATDPTAVIRFQWVTPHGAATSYMGCAAILQFDLTTSTVYAAAHSGVEPHLHGWYLAADESACVAEDSGETVRDVQTTALQTLSGDVYGRAYGGTPTRMYRFNFLTAQQRDRLADLWAYGKDGGGLSLHPTGVSFSDFRLAYALGEATRSEWAPRQPWPGVARYEQSITLVRRGS